MNIEIDCLTTLLKIKMAEGTPMDNRIGLVNTSHEVDRIHTLTLKIEKKGPAEARLVLLAMNDYDKDMLEHTTCL